MSPPTAPLPVFRFRVEFFASGEGANGGDAVPLCSGSFSECTGLEANMEAKSIRVGGQNVGTVQRAGPVSFATVILKRGVTATTHLWQWFELVGGGAYAYRLDAEVHLLPLGSEEPALTWRLRRALPTKFKAADLSAKATEVGVEELHFVHEGMELAAGGGT